MYATVRRYEGVTDPSEVARQVNDGFLPIIAHCNNIDPVSLAVWYVLRSAVLLIFVCGPCKEAFIVHPGYGPTSLQGAVVLLR